MGLSFSQRMGLEPVEEPIQRETASKELRTKVWNILYLYSLKPNSCQYIAASSLNDFFQVFYIHFLNKPLDERSNYYLENERLLKVLIFDSSWDHFFELIEFLCEWKEQLSFSARYISLEEVFNDFLEEENSAYRIVDGLVIEITSEVEVKEIEEAVTKNPYENSKKHLKQAIILMADRENPDFRNSIKESISAVESLVKTITGDDKATLGQALKKIEEGHSEFHGAYKAAFEKLYGWTSDGDGIRHALMEESNLTKADARFMLVACSAFTNYLIDLNRD